MLYSTLLTPFKNSINRSAKIKSIVPAISVCISPTPKEKYIKTLVKAMNFPIIPIKAIPLFFFTSSDTKKNPIPTSRIVFPRPIYKDCKSETDSPNPTAMNNIPATQFHIAATINRYL